MILTHNSETREVIIKATIGEPLPPPMPTWIELIEPIAKETKPDKSLVCCVRGCEEPRYSTRPRCKRHYDLDKKRYAAQQRRMRKERLERSKK